MNQSKPDNCRKQGAKQGRTWLMGVLLGCLVSCGAPGGTAGQDMSQPLLQDQPTIENTLLFTLPYYQEESLHPTLVENQTNGDLAPLLYESLYRLDENFLPHPYLVESHWVTEDGLTWNFTLKPGITFWDGTPLTGDIVASALTEARAPLSRYSARFGGIDTIRGGGDQLEIRLYSPNRNLPALLDIPISYGGGTLPQGTGPYQLPNQQVLRLYPHWWGDGTSLPQEIQLAAIQQTADLISAFDAGKLSLLDGDLTGTNALGFSGNYEVWEYATPQMVYLGYNTQNVLEQEELRRVLSLALDREKLVSAVLAGYATPTLYPIHPQSNLGQNLPTYQYNALSVGPLMESIQLPTQPLTFIYNGESREKTDLAQEITYQLSLYGVKIHLVPLSWAEYLTALEQGEFDLYLGEVLLSPDFELSPILAWGGALNYGAYQNTLMDFYMEEYRRVGLIPIQEVELEEPVEYSGILGEIPVIVPPAEQFFGYFQEQMPFAPLCFKSGTMLSLWGHLQEANPVADNLFYGLEGWQIAHPEAP